MILVALQSAVLIAAGFALFRLWRFAAPAARWLYVVTAAGFLGRAILGQALFWISWASLPIGRSLQIGNGLWIFASDATYYFPIAISAAEKGWRAILFLDRGTASVTYLQLLASMVKLAGTPVSIALLLNLFCYLGTIAILVRWSAQARVAAAVAITALSLSPALVLWSLQPLKDSLFQLLFVAFVAACAAWQRAWNAERAWAMRIAIGALLVVLLFCIAGIRWYFAAVLIAATALFMSGVVAQSASRRGVSIAAVAMMIVLLTETLVLSASPYLPPTIASMLTPRTVLAVLDQTRRGFDQTAATTMIQPGARLKMNAEEPKPAPVLPPAPKPVIVASVPSPGEERTSRPHESGRDVRSPQPKPQTQPEAEARAAFDRQIAGPDVQQFMNGCWHSPEFELTQNGTTIRGWDEASAALHVQSIDTTNVEVAEKPDGTVRVKAGSIKMFLRRIPDEGWKTVRIVIMPEPAPAPQPPPPPPPQFTDADAVKVRAILDQRAEKWLRDNHDLLGLTTIDGVQIAGDGDAAKVDGRVHIAHDGMLETHAFSMQLHRESGKWSIVDSWMSGIVERTQLAPVQKAQVAAVAKARPAPPAPLRKERLMTGSAVLVVPQLFGERLGLFHIGGGRGFLWFAEADTLAFDVVLIFALIVLVSRSRTAWRNPLLWLVLATTLMIFGPLAYSISNFGTLFRLREMIYLGLLLIPLAAATRRDEQQLPPAG